MTYRRFLWEIKKGKISPFYLFEGEERYLKREALKKLKEKLILPAGEDFNFHLLQASRHTASQIIETAYQLPFNSRWQLVAVEEVERLNLKDEERIIDYLKRPVDSTCIVFLGEGLDPRGRFYRFFKERERLVIFTSLREKEAIAWIREKAIQEGESISFEAALRLAQKTGGDVFSLENELNKLLLFVHPEKSIEESHLLKLWGEGGREDIFTLLKAFREKDLPLTLRVLNKLFFRGEEPLFIQAMLVREVRILLRLKLEGSGITTGKACEYIFKKREIYTDFFLHRAREYLEAVKKFTLPHLLFAQRRILTAEFLIKRGRQQPEAALQQALVDILTWSH